MHVIENKRLDEERALYGVRDTLVRGCAFDGPADGESAFKEGRNIETENCFFNLRYPFWHVQGLNIRDCEMTGLCRAALWYSREIDIRRTKLHGIKALRECGEIRMADCSIISPEFGWFSHEIDMQNCTAESEYFMLRAKNLAFRNLNFKGKYSFQYIENAVFENCILDTKDAFWHGRNILVKNCVVKGEYLAWYCENVTFENCLIAGTQPLCYCKELKLKDCEMQGADFAFEKSDVQAVLTAPVISIKNPASGCITLPGECEIIRDDPDARGEIRFI